MVNALKKFGTENTGVAEAGCSAIRILARNDINRSEFGRIECIRYILVKVLNEFGVVYAKVGETGCSAIQMLAYDNPENRKILGRIGVCDAVIRILKERSEIGKSLLGMAVQLVASLAEDIISRNELGQVVVKLECKAVWKLAIGDEENRKELGRVGACEVVVNALIKFGAGENIKRG